MRVTLVPPGGVITGWLAAIAAILAFFPLFRRPFLSFVSSASRFVSAGRGESPGVMLAPVELSDDSETDLVLSDWLLDFFLLDTGAAAGGLWLGSIHGLSFSSAGGLDPRSLIETVALFGCGFGFSE